MTTSVREHPAPALTAGGDGGTPARRAVIRWAWRLFRREWRQQLLVLSLITVAVAGTVLGAAVASNTPPTLAAATFGTANTRGSYQGHPIPQATRATLILVGDAGNWQLAAIHMSFIAGTPGAPPIPSGASRPEAQPQPSGGPR